LSIPIPLFKPLRLQGTGAFLSFVEFTAWLRASGTLNQVEGDTPPVLPRGLCIHYKRSGFTHPHVSLLRCCAFLLLLYLFLSPRALFCHREDFLLCHCGGFSFVTARSAVTKQSHEIASPDEQTRLAMTLFVRHCEGQRPEAISQLRLLRKRKIRPRRDEEKDETTSLQ
jgi:hypothetical protein